MDSAQKKYEYRRNVFIKTMEAAETELEKENPDKKILLKNISALQRLQQRFLEGSDLLLEAKQRSNEDLDTLATLENEQQDIYGTSEAIIIRIKDVLTKPQVIEEDTPSQAAGQNAHRLPKLELPKFGGEARDWLQFWSGFQSIHDDDSIAASVKFQYLNNCMMKGSTAQELVCSYPVTAANYPKVITSLKERFGRDEMLVEVYVRDLIALILENAQNKTTVSFSSLYVKLSAQLRALSSLGVTSDKCAAILYPMVESALPEDIFLAWERNRHQNAAEANGTSADHLDKLLDFLKHEVEGSERIRLARQPFSGSSSTKPKTTQKIIPVTAACLVSSEVKENNCVFCDGKHLSEKCFKAASLSLEDKRKLVQEKRRCFACLKSGHGIKKCRENVKCFSCGKRHQVVLCPDIKPRNAENRRDSSEKKLEPPVSVELSNQMENTDVLFQTVLVNVIGLKKSKIVRAMFDTGSQNSYVLKKTAEEVGLVELGTKEVVHLLFGGSKSEPKKHSRYKIHLASTDDVFRCNFEVQDSQCICWNIPNVPKGDWMDELKTKGIAISNTGYTGSEIEMLLGTDVYGKLLTGERLELESGPVALRTKFGWTISGKLYNNKSSNDSTETVLSYHVNDVSIQDLWNLDLIGIREPMKDKTKEELAKSAMDHFLSTVKRKEDGRYVVHLPWIEGHPTVPDYRYIAEKKLESTTARLRKLQVDQAYHQVFSGWEGNGIIERVKPSAGHYISHHGVIKPESTTTPVRPVFNASFKTKGRPSLNDCLEIGPNMLEEIPTIIVRFRLGLIGVSADIEKAFLQIEVDECHRDFLRFLWYTDEKLVEVQDYRHCRVVFGVSSSPFLLAAVLSHLADTCPVEFSDAAAKLKKSFYVDNCLASMSCMKEVELFKKSSMDLLATARMNLRCWDIGPSSFDKDVPVLGLKWNLKSDTLTCDLRGVEKKMVEGKVTRRNVLSLAHSLFDPVGFTCAVTIVPKMILQKSHKLKGSWDTELPEDISKEFLSWCQQLLETPLMKLPRCLARNQDVSTWSLHVFTDASQLAYAACVYLRSGCPGVVQVELVMARSRVAPIKETTIPRLELVACLCGARLGKKVHEMTELDIPIVYHTDSTTALAWIQKEDNWSVFVAGRVKDIRDLSQPEEWRHVPGKSNPADLPSRGCTMKQLIEATWWEGPDWLKLESHLWPVSQEKECHEEVNRERKKVVISHLNANGSGIMIQLARRSDFFKIVRILAYVRKAVLRFLKREPGETDVFSEEHLTAELVLAKLIQRSYFSGVKDPKLRNRNVFEDKKGLLRIKTRLFYGDVETQHSPVLLPGKDEFVEKLIRATHMLHCHAGAKMIITILREKYWILQCRRTVQSVLRKCVKCRRFRSQPIQVPEGPLPEDRTLTGPAFGVTGVDMAGPLFTKGNKKVWILIFTCATYRGIHLELCSSLSTENFILGFRRFVARRGRPSTIYSDNGLNFVGCSNLLKKLDWNKVVEFANVQQIRWKFNPPTASWWGGFWERMIGIVKQCLRAVLGSSRVNNEELQTLLCDVESVVNNRPLTYVDENEELVPLTPNKFINTCGTSIVADIDAVERDLLVARYRNMQHCRDEMRNRFRKEYLAMLVHRGKQKKTPIITVGDVVLVGSDNLKRIDWPMGIIVEVMPGKDQVVRTVKVKTAGGVFLRPTQRLFPLELHTK